VVLRQPRKPGRLANSSSKQVGASTVITADMNTYPDLTLQLLLRMQASLASFFRRPAGASSVMAVDTNTSLVLTRHLQLEREVTPVNPASFSPKQAGASMRILAALLTSLDRSRRL